MNTFRYGVMYFAQSTKKWVSQYTLIVIYLYLEDLILSNPFLCRSLFQWWKKLNLLTGNKLCSITDEDVGRRHSPTLSLHGFRELDSGRYREISWWSLSYHGEGSSVEKAWHAASPNSAYKANDLGQCKQTIEKYDV